MEESIERLTEEFKRKLLKEIAKDIRLKERNNIKKGATTAFQKTQADSVAEELQNIRS